MATGVLDQLNKQTAETAIGASEAVRLELVLACHADKITPEELRAKLDEHGIELHEVEGDAVTHWTLRWLEARTKLCSKLHDGKAAQRLATDIEQKIAATKDELAKVKAPLIAQLRELEMQLDQAVRAQHSSSRHRQQLAERMPQELEQARKVVGKRLAEAREQVPALRNGIPALERRLVDLRDHLKRARSKLSTLPMIAGQTGDRMAQIGVREARNQVSSVIAEVEREQRQVASNLTAARQRLEQRTAAIARDEKTRQRLDQLVFTAWPDAAEIAQLAAE